MDNHSLTAVAQEEYKQLLKENKRLARELERQKSINVRNQIRAEADRSLERIVKHERSQLERYMDLILDNSLEIILLFDKNGRILYASEYYLKRSHSGSSSMVRGKTLCEILSPFVEDEFLLQIDKSMRDVLFNKRRSEAEHDIDFEGNGNVRHYIMQITPMIGDTHSVEGAMALFFDTTEITKARNEAEQATRAKSDFLSQMSHEMRTPLNAIIGMNELAKKATEMDRMQYLLSKIHEASVHLLGVINDILDISKIEAGKFEIYLDEFDFEDMIKRAVNVNNFRIEEKQQRFMVYIDPKIPYVLVGDEQRLAQVVTNLLSNAIKFTDTFGTVELDTYLERTDNDICTVCITVRDSGIGISPEQLSRLFVNFEQADGSISRRYGGTGLGLAISKSIVEMMNGEVTVTSDLGVGSTFTVSIPMRKGKAEHQRHHMLHEGLRILVADDMPEFLDYFSKLMRHLAIDCVTASSASEVLEMIAATGGFDIYFIDSYIEDVTGLDLAEKIKITDQSEHSIAIMASTAEWESVSEQAESIGVKHFLLKPFFPSAIVDCINECLGVSKATENVHIQEEVSFHGHCILLAEDIEVNREIISALLEWTGLSIDFAENGLEAVEKFAKNEERYGLIFMDVQMPEMDGYQATEKIRALGTQRAKEIPIVAMSANVFREDVERCLAAGMNDHLGKPVDIGEVLKTLKKYLK